MFSHNAGLFVLNTIVKPAASAAPHRAQFCSHSAVGSGGGRGSAEVAKLVCVCVRRRNDREMWRTSGGLGWGGGVGGEDKASRVFFVFFLSVHVSFLKSSKIKTTTKNVHLPVLSKL